MKSIVTFTDGSSYAPSVYQHAAWAAERLGARIEILHTLDPHREKADMADLSGAIGVDAWQSLLTEIVDHDRERARLAQRQGEAILEDARVRLAELGARDVSTKLRHGPFVDALADLREGRDLVVIGKRGRDAAPAMKRLGANLERALLAARCPTLVASREFRPIARFLLAFDGGPSARKAVEYIAAEPLLRGARCHLLRVGADTPEARAETESAADALRASGIETEAEIAPGEPARAIARSVEQRRADLLAMGAYGHSKYKRLLLGSVTEALARECHVPLLMFR